MRNSLRAAAAICQDTTGERSAIERASLVDRFLTALRQSVSECGWTYEALSTEMGIDKGYLSKLLNGEKPLRVEHLIALPDDVEACFEAKRAEGFGLIVVKPVHGDDAIRNLVSGLVGVLGARPQLPARADRMARARLPIADAEEGQ